VIDRQLGDWKGVFHANVESFVVKCWILPLNLTFSAFSGIFYPIFGKLGGSRWGWITGDRCRSISSYEH
jgi:hypothetical protein